ncbi:MAG: NAD(P)/FAD-dependent oxidoreductase [Elusimicrobiota bacterium]
MKNKVIIVGGGPAGVLTAVYLKRFKIDSIIFEKNEIGGTIKYANLVENLPFIKPIKGIEITNLLKKYVFDLKISVIKEQVCDIRYVRGKFNIETSNAKCYSDFLILATGSKAVIGKEFKYIFDDLKDFEENVIKLKNKKVAIIGGGDVAFDYSLNLASRGNKIVLFIRGSKARAIGLLVEKTERSKQIDIRYNSPIKSVYKYGKQYLIEMKNGSFGDEVFDYVFPACGRLPYFGGIKNIDKILYNRSLKNKFFLAGDVKNKNFRQLVNCFSDAMNIAMTIKDAVL